MAEPLTQDDLQKIRDFYPQWQKRAVGQDFEGLAELYTDDTVVMAPHNPMVRGRAAFLEFARTFPRIIRADFDIIEIDGCGDIAYVYGRYSMTLQPEGAPQPVEDRGKYIEIRRRQSDGSWLLSRDIFNSDLPPIGG